MAFSFDRFGRRRRFAASPRQAASAAPPPAVKLPPGQQKPKPPTRQQNLNVGALASLGLLVPGSIRNRVQQLSGTGPPAVFILGNNSDSASALSDAANRKWSAQFTLAAPKTLRELHALVHPFTTGNSYVIHIYADSAGAPGARIAYTNTIVVAPGNSNPVEISQAGFSNALPAANYWLGVTSLASTNTVRCAGTGTIPTDRQDSAAFQPPSDPWGVPTATTPQGALSVWALGA